MIELKNVQHHIAGVKILKTMNLTLCPNQTIALIGPNGVGKSTLLSLMARLEPLQSGAVFFDNMNISVTKSDVVARKNSNFPTKYAFYE